MQQVAANLLFSAINARTDFVGSAVESLAMSIGRDGCWPNNLPIVTPRDGRYMIVAGECRIRAMRDVLAWSEIPCHIEEMTDEQAFERMIVENAARADINPIDEANAMASARDRGWNNVRIGEFFARSTGTVADRLALVNLGNEATHAVRVGTLSLNFAKLLTTLDDNRQVFALRTLAHADDMTLTRWRTICGELQAAQDQSGFFDLDAFTVEDYSAAVERSAPVLGANPDDRFGPEEVADLLGVKRNTLAVWRKRGSLPLPDETISGLPIWKRATLDLWNETRLSA